MTVTMNKTQALTCLPKVSQCVDSYRSYCMHKNNRSKFLWQIKYFCTAGASDIDAPADGLSRGLIYFLRS